MNKVPILSIITCLFFCCIAFDQPYKTCNAAKVKAVEDSVIIVPIDSLIIPDYEEIFHKEVESWYKHPIFSDYQKGLSGKRVRIEGFLWKPSNYRDVLILVERYPGLVAIGCNAGSLRVMIDLRQPNISKEQVTRFRNKEITLEGVLILNDSDIEKYYYMLEDATLLE